jgi:hypothetical protein
VKGTPIIAAAAVAILTGCVFQDPYPLPGDPPGAATFHPVAVGETVSEAVLFIEARRGAQVEIVSVEPIGPLDGVTVDVYAAPLTVDAEGEVVAGEPLVELAGKRIEDLVDPSADPPANTLAVVAELTPTEPGRYVLSDVRLTFRINGAPERDGQGIDVVVTVCAADPAPSDCED